MTLETDNQIIIRTKLHRPPLPMDLVPRSRLLNQLNWNPERPLTLVLAPAGYGKSTLVSAWLEEERRRSIWLSLDEFDNDLPGFLGYFIAAIRHLEPEACAHTLDLLNAAELPALRRVASTLINDLDSIARPLILVLDDYHVIRDMKVHDLLTELLRHPSPALHLVLISRLNPPIDLIKMRASSQLVEIRVGDLRFDTQETYAFLQKSTGFVIDETDAGILDEKCEGWVAALRMATLSVRGSADLGRMLSGLEGDSVRVRDYLTAEVLRHLPQPIQDFLVRTAILERLSGPLCDAVMDFEGPECSSQANLEWLHHVNLFLISLDNERNWFRYHHLFQDMLRRRLAKELDADSISQLHSRASRWFAANGLIDEALQHALIAGDIPAAAQLVEQNVRPLLDDHRWHTLEKRMSLLPESVIQQSPALLIARAWESFHTYALPAIPPILETVESILGDDDSAQSMWGEIDFFWGNHWYWQGESSRSIDSLSRALQRIPVGNHQARGEAEEFWGMAAQMAGNSKEALDRLSRWLYSGKELHPGRQIALLGALNFIHLLSCDLDSASIVPHRIKDIGEEFGIAYATAWSAYLQALVHYSRNEMESAVRLFSKAVEDRYILYKRSAIDSFAGLAFSYQAMGQTDKALATSAELLSFAQEIHDPAHISIARSSQARLSLMKGDRTSAMRQLEAVDLRFYDGTFFIWQELPRLTQCRVLIAQETPTSLQFATEKLQAYRQIGVETHNTLKLVEILSLEFLAHLKRGRQDEALAALKAAVRLAAPARLIRPFVELGPEIAGILSDLNRSSVARDFVGEILAALPMPSPDSLAKAKVKLPEPLSERELEVLGLLAQRLSNKEIANQLVISPLTVKKHASNIYQKLGVKNRRQAVREALALAILVEH